MSIWQHESKRQPQGLVLSCGEGEPIEQFSYFEFNGMLKPVTHVGMGTGWNYNNEEWKRATARRKMRWSFLPYEREKLGLSHEQHGHMNMHHLRMKHRRKKELAA